MTAQGHIYFLRSMPDGPVKIGWSLNPDRRIKDFQTAHPFPLQIIRTIAAPMAGEKALHRHFKPLRLSGEWFTFSADMLSVSLEDIQPVRVKGARRFTRRGEPSSNGNLMIRLEVEDYVALKQLAKKNGVTVSSIVRPLIIEAVEARRAAT